MISGEALMDFKKFVQSKKGLMYSDEKLLIEGTFKEEDGQITSGDIFEANEVWESGKSISLELIYKTYIEWFNYTLKPGEEKRFFVSVKEGEKK